MICGIEWTTPIPPFQLGGRSVYGTDRLIENTPIPELDGMKFLTVENPPSNAIDVACQWWRLFFTCATYKPGWWKENVVIAAEENRASAITTLVIPLSFIGRWNQGNFELDIIREREKKNRGETEWVSEWLSEWVSEWESKRGWRLVVWFLSWKWTPDAFNLSAATVKVFRPPWQHQLFVSHDDMMTRAPNSSHQLQNHIRNLPISKVSNQQSEIYKFQRPLTCWMWLSNFDWEI